MPDDKPPTFHRSEPPAAQAPHPSPPATPTGGAWTYSVYGAAGELLGTFKGCSVGGVQFLCEARLRVYFGGRLILNGWTGVRPDRLGSPDGTHGRVYPYGEVSGSVSTDQDETYTTYTRDTYTGLDYAKNRSYAYAWGRFLTADPYRASGGPENPGSWNRYAYVQNDPTNYTDSSGLQLDACADEAEAMYNTVCIERKKNSGRWVTFLAGSFYDEDSGNTSVFFKQYWVSGVPPGGGSGGIDTAAQVQKCLQGIDEAFASITEKVHEQIDDLLPPHDDRILTPFKVITIANLFIKGMEGTTWGNEFKGVPGGLAAEFVATVVATAINEIWRPIIAPALNWSAKLAVDGVLSGQKYVEKQQQCFGVAPSSMP